MTNSIRLIPMIFLTINLGLKISQAQTDISGSQSGSLGPGIYRVIGNISIMSGNSLTIEPGTIFKHTGKYHWAISGKLTAKGTKEKTIQFISENSSRWGGLRFNQGASHESIFDFCVIDNANGGTHGGGVYIDQVNITLKNTTISKCYSNSYGGGLYAKKSDLLVEYCVFKDNIAESEEYTGGGGLELCDCFNAVIQYCTFVGNQSIGSG